MKLDKAALLPQGLHLLERGWLSSNSLICLGREHCAIIDTGYGSHARQTVALVEHALGARPLDLIVNTHLHSDHCGGNAALQLAFPHVKTWIPPGEAARIRAWDEAALSYKATGQLCPRFGFDAVLQPGQLLHLGDHTFEVHAAPGHDPHAVLLFEPEHRILVSGDALWEHGFGIVFPELEGEPGFEEVGETLELVRQLAPRVVVPGHGRAFDSVDRALEEAHQRLEGMQRDPARHARHAAKVMIKFKLMELQRLSRQELSAWADSTLYVGVIHRRFFQATRMHDWLQTLTDELIASGAIGGDSEAVWEPDAA